MQNKNEISSKEMAQKLQVTEEYIIELCENDFIQGKFANNEWLIFTNQVLPCIKYLDLADNIDQNELNILKGRYSNLDFEELDYWPMELYYGDEFFGFQHIIVSKGIFKDPSGNIHNKYILEIGIFSQVAQWTDSLENILYKVKRTLPSRSNFIAVFNSEAEAYKYAHLIYPELPLIECIKETRERILPCAEHL